MPIDPVLVLAEEIRVAEYALHTAHIAAGGEYPNEKANDVTGLLGRVVSLHEKLLETAPTSALGASELIRFAAERLPFSHSNYITHLHEIADRLGAGQRTYADLIWLRAIADDLVRSLRGETGGKAILMLRLAIKGASRPIVIFRAVDSDASAIEAMRSTNAVTGNARAPGVSLASDDTGRIHEDRATRD